MFGTSPPAHTNIVLGTATDCCLMWFSVTNVVTLGLAVMYIRSTRDQAPASITSCATCGDDFIHGHVFEGKLYFTKDIVDDSFVPRNRKPKPIPKPEAQPALKPAPKGRHVQLFKMRHKVGKGFFSIAPDAPDGQ